ncbi:MULTISPECIES: hypothetical protein [unclassified Meiothermus]|uniref:hypothetical protein n=1 Tax=unclassified Meiothermus TaxID=370471 RepID=UPI001021263F|nr:MULTISPECIES: hypothetical protein [unclassified Meiothermus]RYM37330.1 hypothetical protein EWH23_06500 [Meiothermus sp. PNK-Is4]
MRWLWLLILLAACAPQPTTSRAGGVVVATGLLVVRNSAGVPLLSSYLPLAAYPGSTLLAQRYAGRQSESRFQSAASFEELRQYLRDQLRVGGWQILDGRYQLTPPLEELRIQRGNDTLRLVLRQVSNLVFALEVK